MDSALAQERVREYWNRKPCESEISDLPRWSREYFLDVERRRYDLQPHIPEIQSKLEWKGKQVLEIGTGLGTDARRIIGMGGVYTGINVDIASTEATSRALRAFSRPGVVLVKDATMLDFPDGSFDVVYSFGVLHHIPDAESAVAEIHRILKPGGELLVMLYNRSSINYVIEIMFLRKLFLRILPLPGAISLLRWLGFPRDKLERHLELSTAKRGMTEEEWLSRNTDGPDNPFSRVYGAKEAEDLLKAFQIEKNELFFFDHRHWGRLGRLLPKWVRRVMGRHWGWHRIVYAKKSAE